MPWLDYSNQEVTHFHPAFQEAADNALTNLGLSQVYAWEHHVQTVGVQVVPDFVLTHKATNRWILVVEIKRSLAAVYSERNQVQAKGYAEANANRFRIGRPAFFAISNLENTLLFALNGISPPKDCRVANMSFSSGKFATSAPNTHKATLASDLALMIQHAITTTVPTFETVWPRITRSLLQHADALPYDALIDLSQGAVPSVVAEYFALGAGITPKRELLFRCLIAEYLRGMLARHGHPRSGHLASTGSELPDVANAITALRRIDFAGLFEENAATLYLDLGGRPQFRDPVRLYLAELSKQRVHVLASTRSDALELPDVLNSEAYPPAVRDTRGKAQTDPELASLLAALTISSADDTVLDPCCGDGNLLSAAYDELSRHGATHAQALSRIRGLEADALAAKVAGLRLVLKEPFALSRTDPNHVHPADLFSSAISFGGVDVVLMNPPFKRYEAQGEAPIPQALRQHYIDAIEAVSGASETLVGQANIYNAYVEYIIKVAGPGTTFGIILDNRWFHNEVSEPLRRILLRECEIVALITYPHEQFFEGLMIATSMIVARKAAPPANHEVKFLRTSDPRAADFEAVGQAVRGNGVLPADWTANEVRQAELDTGSWKHHFFASLDQEFRAPDWPNLNALFAVWRRGSLAKEGGGIAVYEFPQERSDYGPRRSPKHGGRSRFQTVEGADLSPADQAQIRASAGAIPNAFLGYAINKADRIAGYELQLADVTRDRTLEAPRQRSAPVQTSYSSTRRRRWDGELDAAVDEIKADPAARAYVDLIEQLVGLDENVLTRSEIWNALREPVAGELIIPRKSRVGHKVHINPFAFNPLDRQVRLSSNFLTYGLCTAIDPATGLARQQAARLIFAFLMSSFGQLQFEMVANNREGARSLEQHHVDRIRVFDPRWVRPHARQQLIDAAAALPFPVATDVSPVLQPELVALDELFAYEIVARDGTLDKVKLLDEVWQSLFDWLQARNS